MTDPIGTAQEREVDRLITLMREAPGQLGNSELEYLADALESRIAEVGRLEERVRLLEGLISEPSIERLAEDIAVACVDCLPHIRVPRHSAMVRLGERLRNPLPNDIDAALSLQRRV